MKSRKHTRNISIVLVLIAMGIIFFGPHPRDEIKALPNIDKTPVSQRSDRDKLIAMLDAKDAGTIFKVIDTIQTDPVLSINCHEIAHDVGHQAFEYYGFLDALTFNNPEHVKHALPQNICAGGYMHGILEQMSLHNPEVLKNPESVCDLVKVGDERASCFHGMGHVYMLAAKSNVPEAILGCRVTKDKMDMYRCFEGVRMEQFWGNIEYKTAENLGWDPAKPLDTCIAAKTDEKPTCFLYSTFGYLKTHPREYKTAAELCAMTPGVTESDQHFCLKGLGMTMMSKFKGRGMEGSEQYVANLTLTQKRSFYQGMVNYSMLSGVEKEQLSSVCGLLKTDALVCLDALSETK